MISRSNSILNKIHLFAWQGLLFTLSLLAFSLILLNRSPNLLRPLSMSLRTGFGLVIPATALMLYLIMRMPGRMGELVGITFVLALFAMPLAGVWASGASQSVLFGGLIPLTDASNYYIDGLRILSGLEISHFSAMRPIFVGFLSLLLGLTDRNLMYSLAIITALAGLAVHLTSREIRRTHGPAPATFLLITLFMYFRHHSGTSMSETLGMTIGTLGMGMIWRGLKDGSTRHAVFGMFALALALNIRPGTLFVLPIILLWLAWRFGREGRSSKSILIWGSGAILLSFLTNSAFIHLLAGPTGTAFSNFSWALFGLAAGGKSFNYIFQVHPELMQIPDPEQSRTIYKLAFDLIIADPLLLLEGAFHRWSFFLSTSWYGAYSFVGGEQYQINRIAQWGMFALCLPGFLRWIKSPSEDFSGLVSLAAIGVLLSVPFVPPTDAYRVRLYASTIIILGLLPALGLSSILERVRGHPSSHPNLEISDFNPIFPYSVLLISTILGSPWLAKAYVQHPPSAKQSCPADQGSVVIRYDPGSSFNLLSGAKVFLDWMPDFHLGRFLVNSHSLASMDMIIWTESIKSGTTLFSTLDYHDNQQVLILAETWRLPEPGQFLQLCGMFENDRVLAPLRIFYADEVQLLEK